MMMNNSIISFYPTIEGNESNFINDYILRHSYYDKLVAFQFGERVFEYDTDSDFPQEWFDVVNAIVLEHLPEWARLYFALNEQYNPLYNVDGTEVMTYGQTSSSNIYGEKLTTNVFGDTSESNTFGEKTITYDVSDHVVSTHSGAKNNTSTDYSTAYNDTTRHESTHTNNDIGESTDTTTANEYTDTTTDSTHTDTRTSESHTDTSTDSSHTDTSTSEEHIDTIRRFGNIGVVSSTKLLEEQFSFYQKSFFDMIFKVIIHEGGLMYE